MKKFTTLLLVLFYTTVLHRTTTLCADINLFDLNENLNSIRIKDQGDMNTCYAHASSTTFNLEQDDPKDFIHPYWIAFIHKNRRIHWKPQNLDFSFLTWAHKDIEKNGVCDINFINEKLTKLKSGVNYTDDKLFFLYKEFFKAKNDSDSWQDNINSTLNRLSKSSEDYSWNRTQVETVLGAIKGKTKDLKLFPFLKAHVFNGCEDNLSHSVPSLKSYGMGIESNDVLIDVITSKLSEHKTLSIGHCPDVTYDPGFLKTDPIGFMPRIFKSFSTKCGAHYANIVGIRNHQNRCEILVRNSYGKDYWPDKSITCLCENKESGKRSDCTKKSFEKRESKVLGCWVEAKRLLDSTYEINAY